MKDRIYVVLFIFLFLWVNIGCQRGTQITITVKGMTCLGCVNAVETSLLAVPGVSAVEISLDLEQALVSYHPDSTSAQRLGLAISKEGGKVAILPNGQEFLPIMTLADVCSMNITKLVVNNTEIYACSDDPTCQNSAKAFLKKDVIDKWKRIIYKEHTIYFCSPGCKIVFEENPEKFLPKEV